MRRPKGGVRDDADHWRGRADAARLVAEQFSDPVAKEMMLQVAHDYDRIAEYIRQQARAAQRET